MRGPRPFRLFLMVILALTPLVQSFWFGRAWRVIDAVAWPGPRTLLQGLWIVAALVVLAAALDMLRVRVLPRRAFGPWGRAVVQLWLIASCLSFLAMMAMESLAWFSRPAMAALPVAQWARVGLARHTVFRYVVWLAGGLPFLAAVYGATVGRLRYRVITVEVPITDLPPHLDGLRIVHLSDIHIGAFMPRAAIRRAVDMSNAVQPDLAVLTGDLISNEHDPLEDCIAELSRLRAPMGVWGCHGNHERWAGVEARGQALFARYGMHVLRQQCVELSWRGGHFNLIGVDDQRERARPGEPSSCCAASKGWCGLTSPTSCFRTTPRRFRGPRHWASHSASRAIRMVVSYALRSATASGVRPGSSRRLWRACIASHTASQRLPPAKSLGMLSDRRFPVCQSGAGHVWTPLRLGMPPEITVLTLRSAGHTAAWCGHAL